MSNTPTWQQVPAGWLTVPHEMIVAAKDRVLRALATGGTRPVGERLARYYDTAGNDVGASFTELGPIERNDITAVDLHATTMISGRIGPAATRRLLSHPDRLSAVSELARLPDCELLVASPATLEAMELCYAAVKRALCHPHVRDPDPWVTASNLCARKRPDLFPVRDPVVSTYLGIGDLEDVRRDWQVFRALVQDADVDRAIDAAVAAARDAAGERDVVLEPGRLRLLDAALRSYAVGTDPCEDADE